MSEVVRFAGPDGTSLHVEVAEDAPGLERIARDSDDVVRAGQRLEDALAQARPAIRSVVDSVRALGPDACEIEFGVKFNAESGVVIAKTAIEGHFVVKVQWSRPAPSPAD
ncbi:MULTISPECIES: CU044_2847 family protein [unclassified Streptomyces]|uniref:CU044_2847 family protein n=1 Tax=unclassified Streptomyces TaxID=2593676 RepID=UPI0035DB04F2